jgi:hypothetical protein
MSYIGDALVMVTHVFLGYLVTRHSMQAVGYELNSLQRHHGRMEQKSKPTSFHPDLPNRQFHHGILCGARLSLHHMLRLCLQMIFLTLPNRCQGLNLFVSHLSPVLQRQQHSGCILQCSASSAWLVLVLVLAVVPVVVVVVPVVGELGEGEPELLALALQPLGICGN